MYAGLVYAGAMLDRLTGAGSRSEPRRPLPCAEIPRPGPEVRFEVWRRIIGD
jgi:hypothetical protein